MLSVASPLDTCRVDLVLPAGQLVPPAASDRKVDDFKAFRLVRSNVPHDERYPKSKNAFNTIVSGLTVDCACV